MGEPFFPKPKVAEREEPYRERAAGPSRSAPEAKVATVVRRPATPPDDELAEGANKPQWSREEMRALLTVTANDGDTRWRRVAKRGVVGFLGTTLISWVAQTLLGWWSIPVLVVAALFWIVKPLWRQRRDGWV
jgi:hypothetical protein